jgi:hypothetical protein
MCFQKIQKYPKSRGLKQPLGMTRDKGKLPRKKEHRNGSMVIFHHWPSVKKKRKAASGMRGHELGKMIS